MERSWYQTVSLKEKVVVVLSDTIWDEGRFSVKLFSRERAGDQQ